MPGLRFGGRRLQASRDYERERAELLEGRDAALAFYKEQSDSIVNDESLSLEEKRAGLLACRSEIERTESEYQESLQALNDEEAESLADAYGVTEDEAEEIVSAEEYCDFDDEEEFETYSETIQSTGLDAGEVEDLSAGYE